MSTAVTGIEEPATLDGASTAPRRPAVESSTGWAAVGTLWRREIVRFLRQRNRVIGALGTPLVFWLVLGSGLGRSFEAGGLAVGPGDGSAHPPSAAGVGGYLEYFFPGVLLMILLFTAIFSTYSVIEDRREGFLQGVLAAPVKRWAIAMGKVLGGATLATGQAGLFLAAWPWIGAWPGVAAMVGVLAMMFVIAAGLTALGLCLAWPMDSTAGFHAIMNLFLLPMWLLSGAAFPIDGAAPWIAAVMRFNPLTYAHAAISSLLYGGGAAPGVSIPLWHALAVTLAASVMLLALASGVVAQRRRDGR